MMNRILVVAMALVALSGCSAVPRSADCGWSHVSHPLLGPPFGPTTEEDSLDTAGCRARWENGKAFMETGLSYRLKDGGFYGDDFIFESRVGIKLWARQ